MSLSRLGAAEMPKDKKVRPEVEALIRETNMGWVTDEEFARRADEIGATDQEIEEAMQ